VVFNLAVIPLPTSLEYPSWTIYTNIGIATTFCELARQGIIQTLIHCSSSEAYGTAQKALISEDHPLVPITPYAASKVAEDHIVLSYNQTFGTDSVIVRPFNNYGPRQNWESYAGIIPIVIANVKNGTPIEIFGDGLQTRDYIFVKDTVDAMVKIYETDATRGKLINVASGSEISVNDLVQKLLIVLNVPDYPVIHTAPRAGDVRRHCGDVQLLRQLTGFQPNAINEQNLRETVNWYQEKLQ
jgi:UDP-glucose 4-epimerase